MTTYAIAGIVNGPPTIDATPPETYQIGYAVRVSVDGGAVQGISNQAAVPIALSAKKADAFIRKDMADKLLSTLGVTIDPDDIYIPFAGH